MRWGKINSSLEFPSGSLLYITDEGPISVPADSAVIGGGGTGDGATGPEGSTGPAGPAGGSPHAQTHAEGGTDPVALNALANPTGSIQFSQQQSLQFVVENRTDDPSGPAIGQIWLRTDL
jgi:hypothetical protein